MGFREWGMAGFLQKSGEWGILDFYAHVLIFKPHFPFTNFVLPPLRVPIPHFQASFPDTMQSFPIPKLHSPPLTPSNHSPFPNLHSSQPSTHFISWHHVLNPNLVPHHHVLISHSLSLFATTMYSFTIPSDSPPPCIHSQPHAQPRCSHSPFSYPIPTIIRWGMKVEECGMSLCWYGMKVGK